MQSATNGSLTEPEPIGVLIVEDEGIVAKDIENTILDLGYKALGIAGSCEQALALARRTKPDLVLMDIRIRGDKDGIETTQVLKREFDVPVIFLTAHSDEATLQRAAHTSPHGYLLKPIRAADIQCAMAVSLARHELETKARRRERWHETLLQSIADAVVAVDAECHVTFLNSAAENALGMQKAVALGQELKNVLHLFAETGEPLDQESACEAIKQGSFVEFAPGRLQNIATKTLTYVERSAAPVLDQGAVLGSIMVVRDVSAAREVQERLELAERLASLGTMAAGVAHEINNPMTVIVGNTNILSSKLRILSEKLGNASIDLLNEVSELNGFVEICEETLKASARVVNIVRDLRSLSRAPALTGAGDVHEALDWAIRSTRHVVCQRAQLVVDRVPVGPVVLNDTKLAQIFVNLLSNAADAIGAGHAQDNTISIGIKGVATDVVITLSDTGAGMSESVKRHVLEPFFTTKDVGKGTGLGLSITHQIVTTAGGSFDLESHPGVGTTITITIPMCAPALAKVKPSALQAPARPARVLYIDDEAIIRKLVARILKRHDLTLLSSAAEALALFEQGERFDIVLCDLTMPTMTGEQFLSEVQARFPEIADRIAIVTGGATGEQQQQFLSQTKNRILQKPFEANSLDALISEFTGPAHEPDPDC